MNELSHAARGVDWLITDFVSTVPGVAHAVVVSSRDVRSMPQDAGVCPDARQPLSDVHGAASVHGCVWDQCHAAFPTAVFSGRNQTQEYAGRHVGKPVLGERPTQG